MYNKYLCFFFVLFFLSPLVTLTLCHPEKERVFEKERRNIIKVR